MEHRSLVTLDLDALGVGGVEETAAALEALGVNYAVYSTRKHSLHRPRLRVLLPTDREMTVEEYEPVARRLCSMVNMKAADPTTFEAHRLMYWPSCCADTDYVLRYRDELPPASVDGVLGLYHDWRDAREWPSADGEARHLARAAKQADPETKRGIVGAFCRVYSIERAIDELLPEAYVPCGEGRYTYTGGSTAGGAVVYGDGRFLFSHHATDPAGGQLVNAFDLVRLHKFGDEDGSFKQMSAYAAELDEVKRQIAQERMDEAQDDFAEIDDKDWRVLLKLVPGRTEFAKTPENYTVMLEHHPDLRGHFRYNVFRGKIFCATPLPWDSKNPGTDRQWPDQDENHLALWLSGKLGYFNKSYMMTVVDAVADDHRYDPVVEWLDGLEWDGTKRVERLLVDYMGALDTPYTRMVTRKWMCACVRRQYAPGTKFDHMLVLVGGQGKGKSALFDVLSKGWFTDSIDDFDGKEPAERLENSIIAEIAEMDGFFKSEITTVKKFITQRYDKFRPAYGHNVIERPRRVVFAGTCNEFAFLKDSTGNRRFWPVDVHQQPPVKHPLADLTDREVDQVWAEAKVLSEHERLYLLPEEEDMARVVQEDHSFEDSMVATVSEWLDRPIPKDWADHDRQYHMLYWQGAVTEHTELVQRTAVCTQEILVECLGLNDKDQMQQKRVLGILNKLGWYCDRNERKYSKLRADGYGGQRIRKRP